MEQKKERHTDERKARIRTCFEFRYERPEGCKYFEWMDYCKKTYNDRSPQTYTEYWSAAGDMYKEKWQSKLENLLDPAVNEIVSLLADPDPKVKQKAIEHIFKYSGNEVTKIDTTVSGEIKIEFGDTPVVVVEEE